MPEECTCFWRPSMTCPIHKHLAYYREQEAKRTGKSRSVVESFND